MAEVRTTEREFQSQVIAWCKEFLASGGYPFDEISGEPSLSGEGPRFPDVQVWLNRQVGQGFCGMELKTPATQVDDPELLKNAVEKAGKMKADYFVTWNMRDTVIWRRPGEGRQVTSEDRLKTYEPLYAVRSVEDLWNKSTNRLLKERTHTLLLDLANLHRDGHLHQIETDTTFFVKRLRQAAERTWPHVQEAMKEKVGKNAKFREGLRAWATKQGMPNYGDEAFFRTASRQIVYRLLGRLVFYQTLIRFWPGRLNKLDLTGLTPTTAEKALRRHFETAGDIDYQAVFEKDFTDQVPLPPKALGEIVDLIDDLNRFNFADMPLDVVGRVFEQLIPPEERHDLGQYFTREDLVDLITAFCVRERDDFVLDPTCGSGTFLLRAYDRLKHHLGQMEHKQLLSQLWGIDVAHFPAELATINLFRQNLADYRNVPRIKAKDFFEVKPGDTLEFAPPTVSEDPEFRIRVSLPEFNAAMGNFPYIRQELIERQIKGYKDKISRVIAEEWLADYQSAFNLSAQDIKDLNNALDNKLDLSAFYDEADFKLSGQADIYAYLFFHVASHLKEGGRMGFVTSNAWLDVAYGYELQRFFLNNFKIVAILESRCEPWFEDPAINTIVTILERCRNKEERDNHLVKFVKVKKRLQELIPWDLKLETGHRWAGIDRYVHQIESAGSEHLRLAGEKYEVTLKGHATHEDENFRIRVFSQGELREEVEKAGRTVKWGRYLRAPEVYFDVNREIANKIVPLGEVADIRFGIKTGINEFFYLTEAKIDHWNIEAEFTAPVLKSPREIDRIKVESSELKNRLFFCNLSKAALRKAKKTGAVRYIEWGEKQKTAAGVAWPNVPSVSGREYWWSLGDREPSDFFIVAFISQRFFFPVNLPRIYVSDVFFEGSFKVSVDKDVVMAFLNSTLGALIVENVGRTGLGEGVLKFIGPEIAELVVPTKISVSPQLATQIRKAFASIASRPIKPIFEEVNMKDRQELDTLLLRALGIDPNKYLKPIYDGLTELVRERIELASMRKKVKQVRTQRDIEKLKQQVLDEILPNGPRLFPKEFLPAGLKKEDFKDVSVPGEPLELGHYFMGRQEVVSEGGFKYEAKSIDEAKFIIYAQKPNEFIVRLPKNEAAIVQAVKKYEKYLRELRDKLFGTFFDRTTEHQMAERLTNQVLQELGLPEVS